MLPIGRAMRVAHRRINGGEPASVQSGTASQLRSCGRRLQVPWPLSGSSNHSVYRAHHHCPRLQVQGHVTMCSRLGRWLFEKWTSERPCHTCRPPMLSRPNSGSEGRSHPLRPAVSGINNRYSALLTYHHLPSRTSPASPVSSWTLLDGDHSCVLSMSDCMSPCVSTLDTLAERSRSTAD